MEFNEAFRDFDNKAQEAAKKRAEFEQLIGWMGRHEPESEPKSSHLTWAMRARKSKYMTIDLATSLDSHRDTFNMITRLHDARGYCKRDTIKTLLRLPLMPPVDAVTWERCLNKIRN